MLRTDGWQRVARPPSETRCGRGEEPPIGQGLVECLAQRSYSIGWNIRSGHDRPPDCHVARQNLQDLTLVLTLAQFAPQRHVGQIRLAPGADLEKDVDPVVAQTIGMSGFQ